MALLAAQVGPSSVDSWPLHTGDRIAMQAVCQLVDDSHSTPEKRRFQTLQTSLQALHSYNGHFQRTRAHQGRLTSCPDTMMDDALPWYPIGICNLHFCFCLCNTFSHSHMRAGFENFPAMAIRICASVHWQCTVVSLYVDCHLDVQSAGQPKRKHLLL